MDSSCHVPGKGCWGDSGLATAGLQRPTAAEAETAPPPRHRAVGERRDGEEGDDEEEVEVGETEEEEEYELEDEE